MSQPPTAKHDNLKLRTKKFVLRIINLVNSLPHSPAAQTIGSKLLESGISVPANYRAAIRARTQAAFKARMESVEDMTDSAVFWIELLVDAGIIKLEQVDELLDEANQLAAIWAASIDKAGSKP